MEIRVPFVLLADDDLLTDKLKVKLQIMKVTNKRCNLHSWNFCYATQCCIRCVDA